MQAAANQTRTGEADLLVAAFRHRKAMMAGIWIIIMVVCAGMIGAVPSSYQAEAEVIINMNGETHMPDGTHIRSVGEMIRSPATLYGFVTQSGLMGAFDTLPQASRQAALSEITRNLSVRPVIGTTVMRISFRAGDPALAAGFVNGLIDYYNRQEAERFTASIALERRYLERQAAELDAGAATLAEQLSGALNASPSHETAQTTLSNRLAQARADLAATEARLAALSSGKTSALSSGDSKLAEAESALHALKAEKAALAVTYGPNHPEMRALDARLQQAQTAKDQRLADQRREAESERAVLARTVSGLETALAGTDKGGPDAPSSARGESTAHADILRLNYEEAQTALSGIRGALNDLERRAALRTDPLTVVSPALTPMTPASPPPALIMGLAAVAGVFCALFAALIAESLYTRFRSPRQAAQASGFPLLAALPPVAARKGGSVVKAFAADPLSVAAERYRGLLVALEARYPKTRAGGRMLVFTSTIAGEGKTTALSLLAVTAARQGRRVLIVDGDLRRPSLHRLFGIGNARGLADYLSDRLPLEEVIYRQSPYHVHILTAKPVPGHALTLMTGDRMTALARRLRDMYDLVLIDAPAAAVFSDAAVLARLADGCVYCINIEQAGKDRLLAGTSQFEASQSTQPDKAGPALVALRSRCADPALPGPVAADMVYFAEKQPR